MLSIFFFFFLFEKLKWYNQNANRKKCRILSNVRNLDVDKSNEMLYNKEQQ